MQPMHSGIISITGSLKTWTWKQSPILASKINEKSEQGAQSDSQGTPKIILNSLKIYTWTSRSLLGVPLDPRITKMVSQVPEMEPPGIQNDSFRSKNDPVQQSTSQQLHADWGPTAGAKP